MNNYLAFNDGCVMFNTSSDDISITKVVRLVDNESGEITEQWEVVVGHTYTAKNFWEVRKGYKIVKSCETEYEAHKVLEDIISKLSENNNVIIVD